MKHILTLLLCLSALSLFSQSKISWKQHIKLADELYMESVYDDAAEHYEAAWRKKPKKKEFIAKAAECYYIIRDYKKAAAAYKHIKDERKNFPLAGLRYARSLKQSGKFGEARQAFDAFIEKYKEADKAVVTKIVRNEIKGCDLGIKFEANPPQNIEISHLSPQINSPETEFAPIPFTKDVLYYSSTMSDRAKIYFSMRDENGVWEKASAPKNFPPMPDMHYCNGSLSPDGKRFYFTICESKESWGGLTTRCDINVIQKNGGEWSMPKKLHNYINKPETTSTHPFVIHEGNKEILFFSSNRPGGKGGMDLWSCERDINSPDIDFSFPKNLGKSLNTIGDEITPFYDTEEGVLYFSSNSLPGLGGQDIFKTTGQGTDWAAPTNIGMPYNSTSDDYYYVKTPNADNGFLSSNRVFGIEKIRTTHEDLFEFIISDAPVQAVAETPVISKKENTIVETKIEKTPPPTTPVIAQEQPAEPVIAQQNEMPKQEAPAPTIIKKEEIVSTPVPSPSSVIQKKETTSPVSETPMTDAIIATSEPYAEPVDETEITEVTLSIKVLTPEDRPVEKSVVGLYKIIGTGGRQLVQNHFSKDGTFALALEPGKYYYLEAQKDGYSENSIEVFTGTGKYLNRDIIIEKVENYSYSESPESTSMNVNLNTSPKTSTPPTGNDYNYEKMSAPETTEIISEARDYTGATYIARGQSKFDRAEFTTDATRHQGEYYKIQLVADKVFDAGLPKFQALNTLGKFDTEFLQKKRLHRVLLGDFFSMDEARDVLRTVQSKGFKRAFVVKYQDGQRYGMVLR